MRGFGSITFGTTPFGLGVADTASGQNRELHVARTFDSIARDFTFDDGGFEGDNELRERLSIILLTTRNSAAASPGMGVNPLADSRNDAGLTRRIQDDLRRALDTIVTVEKRITILSINVDTTTNSNSCAVTLEYRDNRTNKSDRIKI